MLTRAGKRILILVVVGLLLATVGMSSGIETIAELSTPGDTPDGSFKVDVIVTRDAATGSLTYRYTLTNIDFLNETCGIASFGIRGSDYVNAQQESPAGWHPNVEDNWWTWDGSQAAIHPGESAEFVLRTSEQGAVEEAEGGVWAFWESPCQGQHYTYTTLGPAEATDDTGSSSTTTAPLPREDSLKNMAFIPEGCFTMGFGMDSWANMGLDISDEKPTHEVCLDAFYIDEYEVTNRQFKEFAESTGYVTEAEQRNHSFVAVEGARGLLDPNWGYGLPWTAGGSWRTPFGPGSSINSLLDHPVAHLSWSDANAYCEWAGKRLPTEAEWERAARGGLEEKIFPWGGSYPFPTGEPANLGHYANFNADIRADAEDDAGPGWFDGVGFSSAPVGSFLPNDFGLYDMAGNVAEWVSDWYSPDYYAHSPHDNPTGPSSGVRRVYRGGSWLRCECYIRVSSRGDGSKTWPSEDLRASNETGCRCAMDAE